MNEFSRPTAFVGVILAAAVLVLRLLTPNPERDARRAISASDSTALRSAIRLSHEVNRPLPRDTLLHQAFQVGSEDCMEVLLKAGARIDARDEGGISLLHVAAREGDLARAAWLLDHKADVDVVQQDSFVPYRPLHYAVRHGHDDVVNLLLDRGARVCDGDLSSPLDEAVKRGDGELVHRLLERGAAECESTGGIDRAVYYAIVRREPQCLRELLLVVEKPCLLRFRDGGYGIWRQETAEKIAGDSGDTLIQEMVRAGCGDASP